MNDYFVGFQLSGLKVGLCCLKLAVFLACQAHHHPRIKANACHAGTIQVRPYSKSMVIYCDMMFYRSVLNVSDGLETSSCNCTLLGGMCLPINLGIEERYTPSSKDHMVII